MMLDHQEMRRKFISDAFHTLNQPLTGLHCGLEIALQKPRSEDEYRRRIGDGIEHAGIVFALIRAIRQLVDASDPGECFGSLGLGVLLSQMKSELEVVAETTHVSVTIGDSDGVNVAADPGKLLSSLGGLAASEMEAYGSGGMVEIAVRPNGKQVLVAVEGKGVRRAKAEPESTTEKLAEIRRHAAISYLWTIGGDCEITSTGMRIELPMIST
jgi:two-component system heavy metal sensor histidine kinase CusS